MIREQIKKSSLCNEYYPRYHFTAFNNIFVLFLVLACLRDFIRTSIVTN